MTKSNSKDDGMTSVERKVWVKGAITRLMAAWGVEDHKGLSEKLGLYENVPAGWIKNGSVPLYVALACRRDTGQSLDWIYFGIKPQKPKFDVTPEVKEQLVKQANESVITGARIHLIAEKNDNGGNIFAQMIVDDLLAHIDPPDKAE